MNLQKEKEIAKQKFILLTIGNMSLTEINTLSDNEKEYLSKWFLNKKNRKRKLQR